MKHYDDYDENYDGMLYEDEYGAVYGDAYDSSDDAYGDTTGYENRNSGSRRSGRTPRTLKTAGHSRSASGKDGQYPFRGRDREFQGAAGKRKNSYKGQERNSEGSRKSWIPNVILLALILVVCGAIAMNVLNPSEDETEVAEADTEVSEAAASDAAETAEETEDTVDLSDIEEILVAQGLTVMFDGTVFDADWYQTQLASTGSTELSDTEDEEEIYRHYQLYGQGEGLAAYDTSAMDETTILKLTAYEEALREELDGENGTGWSTITAEIYDTEEVTVWNSEYELSDEASSALSSAMGLFEDAGYDAGFVMIDLTTGAALSCRAGVEVYSASVIKAPYIFSLLEAEIEPTDDMYLAGNQSDNDAYVSIRTTYGDDVFAEWIEGTGIPEEQSQTRYITTTPLDLARMFYKGRNLLLGDETYSDWARSTFTDSLNSAAALTIGETKSVYSKAGWISESDGYSVSCYTNAAIVDGDNPYVIAFMSNTPGWTGLTYAQTLLPVLDLIHDEMCGLEVDYSSLDSGSDTSSSDTGSSDSGAEGAAGSSGAGAEGGMSGNPSGLIDENRLWSDGAPDPGAEGGPNWTGESASGGGEGAADGGGGAGATGEPGAGGGNGGEAGVGDGGGGGSAPPG